MNCRSCRAKLSARDQRCPSCGRRNAGGQDLGSASLSDIDRTATTPLPRAKVGEDVSEERTASGADTRRQKRRGDSRPAAEEPALRLTEMVRPEPERARSAPRSRGAAAPATTLSAPGRDEVRAMVAERPQLLENGLRIYTEDGEPKGVGFGTPVGEIDLLARDSTGAWVVVLIPEQGREKELVGEVLELMGWVRKHLSEPGGEEVRAIALLDPGAADLGYAAAAVADTVEFKRYKLALSFEPVEL